MQAHEHSEAGHSPRRPSRLAKELDAAFASCAEWSEVRVVRDDFGQKDHVVAQLRPPGDPHAPYDWAEAA